MAKKTAEEKPASKDEQIGYHKGSLTTLMKERQELVRIVGVVEQLIQMHMSSLKELGVNLEDAGVQQKPKSGSKKPIDEIL